MNLDATDLSENDLGIGAGVAVGASDEDEASESSGHSKSTRAFVNTGACSGVEERREWKTVEGACNVSIAKFGLERKKQCRRTGVRRHTRRH